MYQRLGIEDRASPESGRANVGGGRGGEQTAAQLVSPLSHVPVMVGGWHGALPFSPAVHTASVHFFSPLLAASLCACLWVGTGEVTTCAVAARLRSVYSSEAILLPATMAIRLPSAAPLPPATLSAHSELLSDGSGCRYFSVWASLGIERPQHLHEHHRPRWPSRSPTSASLRWRAQGGTRWHGVGAARAGGGRPLPLAAAAD